MTTSAAASPFAPKSNEKLTLASTVRLMDGKPMPRFGLGAWDMFGAQEVTGALQSAVDKVSHTNPTTAGLDDCGKSRTTMTMVTPLLTK